MVLHQLMAMREMQGLETQQKSERNQQRKKSASEKRKGSSNLQNSNNNKQQKTCNLDSSLPETLLHTLSNRFYYDKLPTEAEAKKIFEFMGNHKPLPAEVSLNCSVEK